MGQTGYPSRSSIQHDQINRLADRMIANHPAQTLSQQGFQRFLPGVSVDVSVRVNTVRQWKSNRVAVCVNVSVFDFPLL